MRDLVAKTGSFLLYSVILVFGLREVRRSRTTYRRHEDPSDRIGRRWAYVPGR